MGLREEKKRQLHDALYEAAVGSFRAKGFDATRVQDIVDEVGVSQPTFFSYFPTKEAVLEEFAARALDGFLALLAREVEDERRTIDTKVQSLLAAVADAFGSDPDFMAVVATRSSLFWGARGSVLERELGIYGLAAKLFERAQRRGEIRAGLDPVRLAETFTGAYMLATVNWLVGWWGARDDLGNRLAELGDVLLFGCLAEPRPRRRRPTTARRRT